MIRHNYSQSIIYKFKFELELWEIYNIVKIIIVLVIIVRVFIHEFSYLKNLWLLVYDKYFIIILQ
jgi:hypothetical protein